MRQTLSFDFDDPQEIDTIRAFMKFHSKRLRVTEDKVFAELAKEFEKQQKIFDYQAEKVKDDARTQTAGTKTPKAKASRASA